MCQDWVLTVMQVKKHTYIYNKFLLTVNNNRIEMFSDSLTEKCKSETLFSEEFRLE